MCHLLEVLQLVFIIVTLPRQLPKQLMDLLISIQQLLLRRHQVGSLRIEQPLHLIQLFRLDPELTLRKPQEKIIIQHTRVSILTFTQVDLSNLRVLQLVCFGSELVLRHGKVIALHVELFLALGKLVGELVEPRA